MKYVLPFNFVFEPMVRLAVISFKGDEEFDGFEPQYFDDPVNGKGIRLLRYRKNGKVDVYYESGIIPDESFNIGAGISDSQMTNFEKKLFEVTENGLQVHLAFTDAQGRKNELIVTESSTCKHPVPLLAPVGGGIENPQKLFLVYMNDFDFTYRETTQIHCLVDNRILEPAILPVPVRDHRAYMARYCSRLIIIALNTNHSNPLCFDAVPGQITIQDGKEIRCNAQGKVEQIQLGQDIHSARLHFPDGFPNLLDLHENQRIKGSFDIYISKDIITGGQYHIERVSDQVYVKLDQFKKWQPEGYPLAYRLLFAFVSIFKDWPTKYEWEGTVKLKETPLMNGKWQNRIHRASK